MVWCTIRKFYFVLGTGFCRFLPCFKVKSNDHFESGLFGARITWHFALASASCARKDALFTTKLVSRFADFTDFKKLAEKELSKDL